MGGCLLVLGTLLMPRVLLFVYWITGTFAKADPWNGFLIPLLGFFFLPATTFVYGICHVYGGGEFTLAWIIGMVLAVLYDLGAHGNAGASRKRSGR